MTNFDEWWRNGGSEKWQKEIDEGGTLIALEMVFDSGSDAGKKESISKWNTRARPNEVLQYRTLKRGEPHKSRGYWSEWQDVPHE